MILNAKPRTNRKEANASNGESRVLQRSIERLTSVLSRRDAATMFVQYQQRFKKRSSIMLFAKLDGVNQWVLRSRELRGTPTPAAEHNTRKKIGYQIAHSSM